MSLCAKANGEVEDLQVYEPRRQERHLDLQKYSWNTPASTDLAPGKVGEIAPLSRSVSLPCAYFTHTAPGVSRRLDPSVRADDGTPAAELRSATLGASLLDEIIQKIISSLLSLLHFPKKKKPVSASLCQEWKSVFDLSKTSLKSILQFCAPTAKLPHKPKVVAPEITCFSSPSVPVLDFYTLHGSFYATKCKSKKRKWR